MPERRIDLIYGKRFTLNAAAADFASIIRGMPQPYLILDSQLLIVGASDAYLAVTERTREDIVGKHILEAFPDNPDAAGTVEQGPLEVSLRHVLATGRPHEMAVIQYDIPRPGGGFYQRFWTPVHSPVIGEDGKVQYIIQNPMDVTQTVLKDREADARLRVALHAANLASWEYEPETDIWRRSHSVDTLFGFPPGGGGPVAAPYFDRIHPDDLRRVIQELQAVVDSPDQTTMRFDYRVMQPSGEVRFVTSRGEVLRTSDGKIRLIGVMMDMTADRSREEELAAALSTQTDLLRQKDLLLAEVNHRVKNSLQLVVSTLRLQSRRLEDPVIAAAFEQAITRVRAIISVHERLYRTNDTFSVDMSEHLQRLVKDFAGEQTGKVVIVDVDEINLAPERAIPVSIIANELLTAMDAGREGSKLLLSLKSQSTGKIRLEVADSAPEKHLSRKLAGLAERLVAAMAAQLGAIAAEAEDGHSVSIVFAKEGE